jgi:hypothetical protein
MREKITAIIPTRKEDLGIIEGALKSIQWVDEILVVDSSFSENVKKMALKWGAKYFSHEYVYSAKQKNWIIPKAKHNWILLIDSDEVITKKLQKNIQEMLRSPQVNDFDGYGIARKHFFFGKFLRWGGRYPLYNIRLFKKSARYEDRDVHAHIILDKDKVFNINPKKGGDMLHFSDRNFEEFFERFDRYSNYQASYMKKINKKGIEINWVKFFSNYYYFKAVVKDFWFFIPGSSFFRFAWMYFFKLGFLDGRYGFMIALFYAFQDYVSKVKFKEIYKVENRFSLRVSDYLMRKMMPVFMKNDKMSNDYSKGYNNCFNLVK